MEFGIDLEYENIIVNNGLINNALNRLLLV